MANLNFEALRDLHESANHLLCSPVIGQSLLNHEKWIHNVSESSLTMLDVCSISKDALLLMKDHVQDLRCTLRRSNSGQPGEDNPVAAYNLIKRKLKKETVECLRSLKGMKVGSTGSDLLQPVDHRLGVVEDMLREVRLTIVAMVESISTLMAIPWLEGRSTRGSIAAKLMRSRAIGLDDTGDRTALESADTRLVAVEIVIEDLEIELECMFRRLIQTRVSLLNILTAC